MQNAWRPDISEAEARSVIEDGMRVLFYRDKKASDYIQICKVTQQGVAIEDKYKINSEWSLDSFRFKTNEYWRPMRLQEKEVKHQ